MLPQLIGGIIAMVCLDKIKNYINDIKGFRISVMLLVESGLADIALTIDNVTKYGIEYEGNPILRTVMEHLGIEYGLLIPKILALVITTYTAHKMNKTNYKIKGEHLLYGASICWLYGAVSHSFF